jgi:hypothetical protein
MSEADAVRAVTTHLQQAFPGSSVQDAEDDDRHAYSFRLTDASGGPVALVTVSDEFLEDVAAQEIDRRLATMRLADVVRAAGPTTRVIVATTGVRTEAR